MVKKLYKLSAFLLAAMFFLLHISTGPGTVHANNGSDSYNYSFWGESVPAPAAFQATKLVNGASLGIDALREPNDLYVTSDNFIYVMDTGNNRVVIIDEEFHLVDTIDSFLHDGNNDTFSNPRGLFVTDDKHVLIADTGNHRVVHLDQDFNLVKIVDEPQSDLLRDDFVFQPVKVVVDKANRIYVLASGVFDGFMEFDIEGDFTTFIGANRVQVDPIEYFWRRVATREQRSQMRMFIPTEFSNLDINDQGFIYASSTDGADDSIKKLNARGTDILRREGYFSPVGDIRYDYDLGPSRLIDIAVTDSEIYSVLDSRRGRIFTYDGDGHLMYMFGGLGNQLGKFNTPIAIDWFGEDFLVLDRALGEITVFRSTDYGRTLTEAVRSYYRGDEEKANYLFEQTINMNANLDFAYSGIGKALLRQGDYYGAMHHFEQSYDRNNYSKAFLLYRNEVLRQHFSTIMTGIMLIAVGYLSFKIYRKVTRRRRGFSIE
ncbi:hypothetical protein J2S74_000597 [Evansella vedderi]|uniref:NHL repeat-containing protein n=1 Tax=Evansella vedderi TaxID=38282 RepID=A0ABT9ZSS3_9BACI|nr:NHL repeat-containing protein [Evansella vedderi]MDQ0253225.1 hypothetical protein [Evansella vedderi]